MFLEVENRSKTCMKTIVSKMFLKKFDIKKIKGVVYN